MGHNKHDRSRLYGPKCPYEGLPAKDSETPHRGAQGHLRAFWQWLNAGSVPLHQVVKPAGGRRTVNQELTGLCRLCLYVLIVAGILMITPWILAVIGGN